MALLVAPVPRWPRGAPTRSECDFALPAGTPPNAIIFGSGYVRLPTMMKVGVTLDVLAAAILTGYGLAWVRFVLG